MAKTIVALYDDVDHAQKTIQDLVDTGIDRGRISLMANNQTGKLTETKLEEIGIKPDLDELKSGTGSILSNLHKQLDNLGSLLIPGVGQVLAAGPLATALSGVSGAGKGLTSGEPAGGLINALGNMGINQEQAGYFAEGIRRGGTLITVRIEDQVAPRVMDIMNQHEPADVKQRASQWRASGWMGFDPNREISSTSGVQSSSQTPMGFKDTSSSTGTISDSVFATGETKISDLDRKTVEDRGNIESSVKVTHKGIRTFDTYAPGFRSHFDHFIASKGYTFNQFLPAYRFGYDEALLEQYRNRNWEDVEMEIRRDWESRYPNSTWEDFKGAVYHSWNEVTRVIT